MATVVIAEFMDEAAVARLSARWQTLSAASLVDRPGDLRAALADARALIVRNRTQVNADLLEYAPKLELVGRLGVGLDNIDLAACAARNINVHPATGANDDAVAEYVAAAAMILRRPAFLMSAQLAAGAWPRNQAIGRELLGACAGLVGFGRTARGAARRLAALGMHIIAHDPMLPAGDPAWGDPAWGEAEPVDLNALLERADLVSLHVPLTPGTTRMIDVAALARMKPEAILINAARGGIVDEPALAAALRAGQLAGAALDVFETEPLNAAAASRFANLPNLILTPHIAGVTAESNVRVSSLIADIVLNALEAP
jgi:(S)-sulfolactate dehydrogenase